MEFLFKRIIKVFEKLDKNHLRERLFCSIYNNSYIIKNIKDIDYFSNIIYTDMKSNYINYKESNIIVLILL